MNQGLIAGVVIAIIIGALLGFAGSYLLLQPMIQNAQNSVDSLMQTVYSLSQTVNSLNQSVIAATSSSIRLGYLDTLGYYLEDQNGRTLYYFARDVPASGVSNCTGTCEGIWPHFYTSTVTLPLNPPVILNASDFVTINSNGTLQTTYRGYPLYYFINDTAPGQINGQGVANAWWVMKPSYSVMLSFKSEVGGLYLTDNFGRTLYQFLNDTPGSGYSNCTSATCAQNWPAFHVQAEITPSYLDASEFSTITRSNGVKQLTYKGWPLYYFIGDTKPGEITGQGVVNLWYAMKP